MTTILMRQAVPPLFLLASWVIFSSPAEALPIKNADKCNGPVTIGVATCPDKPGHWVECTNGGDYMCCVSNSKGGKDCEQVEDTANASKFGKMRAPTEKLQLSPSTTTAPIAPTTRMPKTGTTTAPIMRRGVEGEQGAEPPSESGTAGEKVTEQGK